MLSYYLLVLLFVAGFEYEEESKNVNVVRAFDASSLLAYPISRTGVMMMLPYTYGSNVILPEQESDVMPVLTPEVLVELIQECVCRDVWEEDDVYIKTMDGNEGKLLVRASSPVLDQIEYFLEYLNEAFISTEILQIRVAQIDLFPESGLYLNPEEADRFMEEWVAAGTAKWIRSACVALPDGGIQQLKSIEVETYLFDWEPEIAQGAVISEPISIEIATGLEALVKANRIPNGTYLDLMVRHSGKQAPPVQRSLNSVSSTMTDKEEISDISAGLVEHPEIGFTSYGGSFVIPDEKVLWIATTLETQSGPVNRLLEFRIKGTARPWYTQLAMDPFPDDEHKTLPRTEMKKPYQVGILHVGSAASGGVMLPSLTSKQFDIDTIGHRDEGVENFLIHFANQGQGKSVISSAQLTEIMERKISGYTTDPRTYIHGMGEYLIFALPSECTEKAVAEVKELMGSARMVELHGSLLHGEGKKAGDFRLPVLIGKPACVWSGVQGSLIKGWDVDVATESMIANPNIVARFDCYALQIEVHPSAKEMLQVTVNGMINIQQGDTVTKELGVKFTPFYEKTKRGRMYINDMRSIPDHGTVPALCWGDDHLGLELEIKFIVP